MEATEDRLTQLNMPHKSLVGLATNDTQQLEATDLTRDDST